MRHNRLEINAAIERLLSNDDFDLEAARIIINFGLEIEETKNATLAYSSEKMNSSSFRGYVSGIGDVEYKKSSEKNEGEKTFGIYEDRVGKYKLRRTRKEGRGIISIRYFWKADITTASSTEEDVRDYHLHYNLKTSEPEDLAILIFPWKINFFRFPYRGKIVTLIVSAMFDEFIKGKRKGKKSFFGIRTSLEC